MGRRARAPGTPGSSRRRRRLPRSAPCGRRLTGHRAHRPRRRREGAPGVRASVIPRRTVSAKTCCAASGAKVGTGAAARSPASAGRTRKRRPRSPRTAATASRASAMRQSSGSCPTRWHGSARVAALRCSRRGSGRQQRRNGAHPRLEVRSAGRRVHPLRRAGHARRGQPLPRSGRAFCRSVVPPGAPRRGHTAANDPLGADSIRAIVRRRAAAVDGIAGRIGGHSLRVGSARDLAADGASVAELQQAGGWKSPTTPGVYIRREAAARGPVARRRYKVGA